MCMFVCALSFKSLGSRGLVSDWFCVWARCPLLLRNHLLSPPPHTHTHARTFTLSRSQHVTPTPNAPSFLYQAHVALTPNAPLFFYQARKEGEKFRTSMYPNDGRGGLLRLHSTYRHDLKVYSSDEGRVQTTAASFAKGLLGLDGSIPPILASLIQKVRERECECE
jgi:hypothetical protein